MARALQRILTKQQSKVAYQKNKSALLMVFADNNHNAIAQLLKAWVYSSNKFALQSTSSEPSDKR